MITTTFLPKEKVNRKWFILDASGQTLGRFACKIANILRGKTTPAYTPHTDSGDYVIVINAEKVLLTGRKMRQKLYRHHSGYPGGLKERTAENLKPEEMVRKAVWGMIPTNRLRSKQIARLKIFDGPEHGMQNHKPEVLNI